ncbi:25449_t:CDS:2 [Gigaspora margarita]|uniref:25449_t:CDS:1 n=1 Tax=Gigaspora margarita TaxID=4874 RepID=A0ABN7VWQ4_GIGMA|nr:25449_t:CDS:2 [Gigaspora margarita]
MFSAWNNTIGGIGEMIPFMKIIKWNMANEANVPFYEWNCVDNTFNEPNNNNQAEFDVNSRMLYDMNQIRMEAVNLEST